VAAGGACSSSSDCCGGRSCENGHCYAVQGGSCSHDSDCFGGGLVGGLLCVDGVCCLGWGDACGSATTCCANFQCDLNTSISAYECCPGTGGRCRTTDDCCAINLQCQQGLCCNVGETECTSNAQCCSGHCGDVNAGVNECCVPPGGTCNQYSPCCWPSGSRAVCNYNGGTTGTCEVP
jgi:hypothetical protein